MHKVSLTGLLLMLLLPLCALAQGREMMRGNCLPEGQQEQAQLRRALTVRTQWDGNLTYRVPVVLVSFADCDFSPEHTADYYRRLFNEDGFNEGKGPGCVAEYFRQQSAGLFNAQFDIYGPVKLEQTASNNSSSANYGASVFQDAVRTLADQDFTPYDWDGNGRAEAVIVIYAGFGGNEKTVKGKGYIWPNTSTLGAVMIGNVVVTDYSASAERWVDGTSCGIGTICHEYSHSLGLPDIYPTKGTEYSVCDEWDLMDGGNFIDDGWCPPSYSAQEKMLLGWLQPLELTESLSVDHLLPLDQQGQAFIIRTDNDDEFFLLENRQWSGWDQCLPGHGLLIAHVDFSASAWHGNSVNTNPQHHRYDLVHADNRTYDEWKELVGEGEVYIDGHSRLLSGTAYPLEDGEVTNCDWTDTSTPAATTYSGQGLLSKPVTGITEDEEGAISFHFMGGSQSGIDDRSTAHRQQRNQAGFDLLGRKRTANDRKQAGLYILNRHIFFNPFINKHN